MKYGIPIVDEQYIHDCVQAGTRLDISKYVVPIQVPPVQPAEEQQAAEQLQLTGMDPAMAQAAANAAVAAAALTSDYGQDQSLVSVRQALQQMIHTHTQQGDPMGDGMMLSQMGTTTGSPELDMSENSKFTVKMYVKGSRQTVFSEQFPEILYTLTWKHKYDIRIVSNKKIFKGEQNKLLEAFTMMLVLAKNNEIPIYDEEKEIKRRRKRQKIAKRKQKKPTDTDTVTISSLHKAAENEVIIRFGINSTFCSKRFNYSAFRLYINYAPQDLPDDYHFTIYSAEFKTFVKKNANITKYLHYPKPLNPTTTIITKETTVRTKTKYAQVTKNDTGSSFGGSPGNATSPRKGQRKRKKNTNDYEEDMPEEDEHMMDEHAVPQDWEQQNLMNMIYPLLPMMQQQQMGQGMPMQYAPPMHKNIQIPDKGVSFFGEPIGMNINGDVFYMAFCKDGVLYKINDFVYLAPEEGSDAGQMEMPQHGDMGGQQMDPMGAHPHEVPPVSDTMHQHDPMAAAHHAMGVPPMDVKLEDKHGHEKDDDADMPDDEDDDGEMPPSQPSAPESYWICKIINLVQTKTEGMKLIGQWFYRWCDVQGFGISLDAISKNKSKKQFMLQKEKEVFVSFDLNYNSLNTVRGKCFVKFMEPEVQKKSRKIILKPHHYYFFNGFNRLKAEFFELPDTMLKIMKETTNEEEDTEQFLQMYQQQQAAAAMQQNAMGQMGGPQYAAMQAAHVAQHGMPGMMMHDPSAHVDPAAMHAWQHMQQAHHPQHMDDEHQQYHHE